MLQKKGSPAGFSKKFPCRGGESIRRRSTPTLSNRRLDILLPLSLRFLPFLFSSRCLFSSFSFPRLEFERIIIRGTRAHGLSSREFSESSLPPYSRPVPRLSLTASLILVSDSLILGRNLDLLCSYTTRPHAGGAAIPYYHTIFMLAPPGPQSCTTAHYTVPNSSCNVMYVHVHV